MFILLPLSWTYFLAFENLLDELWARGYKASALKASSRSGKSQELKYVMLNNPAFHLLFVVMFVKSIFCLINPLALFQSSPTLSGAVIDRPVICNKLILVFHHDEKPCLCIIKCKVWFWISFLVDRSYRSNRGCSTLCVCACYKISDYSDIFRSGVRLISITFFFLP